MSLDFDLSTFLDFSRFSDSYDFNWALHIVSNTLVLLRKFLLSIF